MSISWVFLALLASLFFAVTNVLVKRGSVSGISSASGYLVSLIVSSIFFTILFPFFLPTGAISIEGIGWFALSGVAGSLLGRGVQYVAIGKMGASTASPVANTNPIFSSAVAIGFLGEPLTFPIAAGTILTVLGLLVISKQGEQPRSWNRRYIAIPLASAFFFGLGNVFRKVGSLLVPDPIFAASVNTYAALVVYAIVLVVSAKRLSLRLNQSGAIYYGAAGTVNSLGTIAVFAALNYGFVETVAPLASIAPLFVLILAYFFLREEELSLRIVLGVAMIVGGVTLVVL